MPIPTPAPPVKRYAIGPISIYKHGAQSWQRGRTECSISVEPHDEGHWVKWSEAETILLQRAQEIAEANEKFVAAEEDWHQAELEIAELKALLAARAQEIADRDVRGEDLQAAYLDLQHQLTARAQEIEQVKAALRAWREFDGEAADQNPCPDLTLRSHLRSKARELTRQIADAALISRAPQPEQEQDYDEAKRYLILLFGRVAPQCKPLPTLSGLATQIDNYIAGLLAAPLPASAALPALIAEYRRIRACSPAMPWCSDPSYANADHYDGHAGPKDAVLEEIFAAAVSRAQQPEQDTQQLVQELTAALQERPDRERTHWAGCHTDPTHRDCAIARLLAALARADQP